MTEEAPQNAAIETIVVPSARDLGGFSVARALPSAGKRAVGPFVFLDRMGPADFAVGSGIDVRPHPHIGLATLTYLLEGELFHRDSLGSAALITPGAVNLMTAGRGIVHSERSTQEFRRRGGRMFGLQTWLALPTRNEETNPAFEHFEARALPTLDAEGKRLRVAVGAMFGLASPVQTFSPCFFVDADLRAGAMLPIDADYEERALFICAGVAEIDGETYEAGRLIVLRPGRAVTLKATTPLRLALFGGAALDGPRYLWWNFVSSDKERIKAAKADWEAKKFAAVEGDPEFIPAPDTPTP